MQVDDAHDIDVVMTMYNLKKYSDNYSKTSGILCHYCRDEPVLDNDGKTADFTEANAITDSFKVKAKITVKTVDNSTKDVEIMVPLKYLSNFEGTLEISLINCEINFDLNWTKKSIIVVTNVANQVITFSIADTKISVPVVTLWTQDNAKLLEQLKSGFKRTIN